MMNNATASMLHIVTCPHCENLPQACASCGRLRQLAVWGPWVFAWRRPLTYGFFVAAVIEIGIRRLLQWLALAGAILLVLVTLGTMLEQSTPDTLELSWRTFDATAQLQIAGALLLVVHFLYRRWRWAERDRGRQLFGLRVPSRLPQTLPELLERRRIIDLANFLSAPTQRVLLRARMSASLARSAEVQPIHLFIGCLTDANVIESLTRIGAYPRILQTKARRHQQADRSRTNPSQQRLSRASANVFFTAFDEAMTAHAKRIQPVHILAALTRQEGFADAILAEANVTVEKIRAVVEWLRLSTAVAHWQQRFRRAAFLKPTTIDRAKTAIQTPFLDRFSNDITKLAARGHYSTIVGRDAEIDQIFDTIRSGHTNVLLVGDPGVGVSSVIAAIAQKMVLEQVPPFLADKRLVSLDISRLTAGATALGKLEERLQGVVMDIVRAGNIVLALENVHLVVGLGGKGGLDLSEILLPILERQPCVLLGTAPRQDFYRVIEKHQRLSAALRTVMIEEMTPAQTTTVLEALVPAYEQRYHVRFTYDALRSLAEFAAKYVQTACLPGKALVLLPEVAQMVLQQRGRRSLVTEVDVRVYMSQRTSIPLVAASSQETDKLLHLEELLHRRIVGQEAAVKAVAAALRRSRADMRDPKRPIANFLFVGPTGVGKTELAKTIAAVYLGAEDRMVRFDMSEFQERSSLQRLIGAPPGSGAEAGQLTEAVRLQPSSLLLFDELEKAHPDILNLFLQMMDDGRLSDNFGRTIDFTNTIIIATSNAGSQGIADAVKAGKTAADIKTFLLQEGLRQYYRPELLNRFDDVIVFTPLTQSDIAQIAALLLATLQRDLERRGIRLQIAPEAIQTLAAAGFDPVFGARPLKRLLTERVNDALASFLLQGKIGRRDTAILQADGTVTVQRAVAL